MKKIGFMFLVLLYSIQSFAQDDESYLKTSIAMSLMGSQSEDPNFKLMGISRYNRIPSIHFSKRPFIYSTDNFQFFTQVGAGIHYRGFGYTYNSDTSYYLKIAGPSIRLGIGIEYNGLGRFSNEHPITFSISYVSFLPFVQSNYVNKRRTNMEFGSDYKRGFMHGLSMRLDYRLNTGEPGVNVFTTLDYYPKQLEYFAFGSMFTSYTLSIGIALTTRDRFFEPMSF
jgi:hypothetical protein